MPHNIYMYSADATAVYSAATRGHRDMASYGDSFVSTAKQSARSTPTCTATVIACQ